MGKASKLSDSKNSKSSVRQLIEGKIEQALADLRPTLGEKKFKRRIKKAGKIITSGLSKTALTETIVKPIKPVAPDSKSIKKKTV
jgi:hypothetical protein